MQYFLLIAKFVMDEISIVQNSFGMKNRNMKANLLLFIFDYLSIIRQYFQRIAEMNGTELDCWIAARRFF